MRCKRARIVASALKVKNYANLSWPSELAPAIKTTMAENQNCTVCGGGPCDPETHKFPATNPYIEIDELGNPIDPELLPSDEENPGAKSPTSSPSRNTLDAFIPLFSRTTK